MWSSTGQDIPDPGILRGSFGRRSCHVQTGGSSRSASGTETKTRPINPCSDAGARPLPRRRHRNDQSPVPVEDPSPGTWIQPVETSGEGPANGRRS